MREPSELTIKLTVDTTKALESIANVKAELEQVIALQDKVNKLGTDNK